MFGLVSPRARALSIGSQCAVPQRLVWAVLLALGCVPAPADDTPANVAPAQADTAHAELAKPAPANAAPIAVPQEDWPLFRGTTLAQGISSTTFPVEPEVLWKQSFEDESFEGTAIIQDGTIYVGGLNGPLYAIDLETGKTKWTYKTEVGIKAAPAYRDGKVYVGDFDGKFHCVDAATGKPLWTAQAQAEIDSGANFFGDNVIFGSQDATLYCFNATTGKEVWKHTISDQIRCFPTIVDGRCFVAGCDGDLHVIDVTNGQPLGKVRIDSPTGCTPAVVGDMLYFGTEGETFLAIDWKDQNLDWTYRHPQRRFAYRSSAAVYKDTIVVGNRGKMLIGLDRATGKDRWIFNTKTSVESSPVIVPSQAFPDGVAYFGTSRGQLLGVNVKTGEQVWEYDAGGGFEASPAIASGRMVIGSFDGVLYCFGAKQAK